MSDQAPSQAPALHATSSAAGGPAGWEELVPSAGWTRSILFCHCTIPPKSRAWRKQQEV